MTRMLRLFNKLEEKEFQKFLVLAGIVTLSYYIKIITFVTEKVTYFYDEVVITQVSRLPLRELFDTIHAEPHPPGHYLFLKLLPTNNVLATLIIITTISSCLAIYAFWLAYKTQIMQKYNLWLGLVFFACSFTFISITGDVRQYSISVPVMLITLVLLLDYWSKEKVDKRTTRLTFIKINLLAAFILLWGYIPYLSLIGFIGIFFLFSKNRKPYLVTLLLQGILAISYMASFGYEQMVENSTRFGWFEFYNANLAYLFSANYSGVMPWNAFTVIAIVFYSLGLILFVFKKPKSNFEKIVFTILTLGICLFLLSNFGINTRYFFAISLFLSIITGWGYQSIRQNKLKPAFLFLLIISTLFFGVMGNIELRLDKTNADNKMIELLSKQAFSDSTAITGIGILPFIYEPNFPGNYDYELINIIYPEMIYEKEINRVALKFADYGHIDEKDYKKERLENAIAGRKPIDQYVFLGYRIKAFKPIIDTLREVLRNHCKSENVIFKGEDSSIEVYSECEKIN